MRVLPTLRRISLYTGLLGTLCFAGWKCGKNSPWNSITEGMIVYDVSYPLEMDNPYLNIYPSEMTFLFKGGKVKARLASFADVVTSEFIIDHNKRTFVQYFKAFDDKFRLVLDHHGVKGMLKELPDVQLNNTMETDSLAGFLCRKSLASFATLPEDKFTLYHTRAIDIDSPNWCNKYNAIDEVLLAYDIEQFGKRLRLKAKKVVYQEIPDEKFAEPEGYEDVSIQDMNLQIQDLMSQFKTE
jgi:hypothetical protein